MVTYDDVINYLEDLKKKGKIIDYSTDDKGHKVVINVVWLLSDNTYDSRNYVLLIKHRGKENEQVFFKGRSLFNDINTKNSTNGENIWPLVEDDLKNNWNVLKVIGKNDIEDKLYFDVMAFEKVGNKKVSITRFFVPYNTKNKKYKIYKVV